MARALGSGYLLDEVIGRGAMGQVWSGRTTDGVQRAFKLLRPELAEQPEAVQRFVQERSILTAIEHPNVVAVHDLVAEGETLAIVMDRVDGGDLRGALQTAGTFRPAEVASLGSQVSAGLAAAYEQTGAVHRDLKPENVLMDSSTNPATPRITDFGIAQLADIAGSRTSSSLLVGTPQYVAPERAEETATAGPASDLYSLGILLYELCCGVTPFAGGSALAVLRRQSEQTPGRPDGIPEPLWDMINWLLAKSPAGRPQSARQVATILEGLVPQLAGIPAGPAITSPPQPRPGVHTQHTTAAPRPSAHPAPADSPAPTGKRRRRRRGAAVATAAVAILAVAAGGIFVSTRDSGGNTDESANAAREPVAAAQSEAPSTTAVSSTEEMPDLVGWPEAQARAKLPPSVMVNTVPKLDEQHGEGTVLAQNPPAGAQITGAVTLTVARRPVGVFLASLEPVTDSGLNDFGPASVSGQKYTRSLIGGINGCEADYAPMVQYDLGRHYERLTTTVGISDRSENPGTRVLVEIYVDGTKAYGEVIPFGQAREIKIDTADALRLRLQWVGVGEGENCTASGQLVFGNARLTGVPGEVPTPTTTDGQ